MRLEGGGTCRKSGLAAMGLCKPGGTGMAFTLKRLGRLDRTNGMYVRGIVREVPDFAPPDGAGSSGGRDYMRAFGGA